MSEKVTTLLYGETCGHGLALDAINLWMSRIIFFRVDHDFVIIDRITRDVIIWKVPSLGFRMVRDETGDLFIIVGIFLNCYQLPTDPLFIMKSIQSKNLWELVPAVEYSNNYKKDTVLITVLLVLRRTVWTSSIYIPRIHIGQGAWIRASNLRRQGSQ